MWCYSVGMSLLQSRKPSSSAPIPSPFILGSGVWVPIMIFCVTFLPIFHCFQLNNSQQNLPKTWQKNISQLGRSLIWLFTYIIKCPWQKKMVYSCILSDIKFAEFLWCAINMINVHRRFGLSLVRHQPQPMSMATGISYFHIMMFYKVLQFYNS